MVGAFAGDLIADLSPAAGGGEVQQVGLPVAPRVQHLLVVEQRRDEAQNQLAGRLTTALQIGQAEDCLHRVRQDRILIRATGVQLSLAKPDVTAQVQVASHLR